MPRSSAVQAANARERCRRGPRTKARANSSRPAMPRPSSLAPRLIVCPRASGAPIPKASQCASAPPMAASGEPDTGGASPLPEGGLSLRQGNRERFMSGQAIACKQQPGVIKPVVDCNRCEGKAECVRAPATAPRGLEDPYRTSWPRQTCHRPANCGRSRISRTTPRPDGDPP